MKSGVCVYVENGNGEKIPVSIADRRLILYKVLQYYKQYCGNDWIPFDVLINDDSLLSGFYVDESKTSHDICATLRTDIHAINGDPNFEELIVVVNNACKIANRDDYNNERKRLINRILAAKKKLDNIDYKACRNGQARDLTEEYINFWKTF